MNKLTAVLLVATIAAPTFTFAQERAGAGEHPAAPAVPGQRTRAEVGKDIATANEELDALIPSEATLHDPAKRAEIAGKAVPVLKRLDALLMELVSPSYKALSPERVQLSKEACRLRYQPQIAALGDSATLAMLEAQSKSTDAAEANLAKAIVVLSRYISAADDAGQIQAAKDMAAVLADSGKQTSVDMAASTVIRARPLSDGVRESVAKTFKDFSNQYTKAAVADTASANSLKVYENKPIVLAGETVNGKQFSTASLKGKVILVDFWATWCAPCKAELPRVKKLYAQYKDKGLEVVGVSCDNKGDALMSYLAANPDMPWTQMFDVNNPGWHPLAKQYGITGIPVMFLIDKNGVCRSVEARENMETLIPKLLAEQAGM